MSRPYYYFFENDIDSETVQDLIDKIDDKEKIKLYFTTHGGYTPWAEFLRDYLNSRKDDIEIIFTNFVASCGTMLLVGFEGKVTFSDELDTLLFHKIDRELYHQRKQTKDPKELRKMDKEYNKNLSEKFRKLGLNDKEIKKFNKGEDVVLYKKDFHRLNINKE